MPTIIDPAQRLIDRAQWATPRLTRAITNAVTAAESSMGTLGELAESIQAGRWEEALDRAIQSGSIAAAEGHAAIYVATGTSTAEYLTSELGVTVGFDQVNNRAVRYMQQQRLTLIREWTQAQRDASRIALVDGIRDGLNPIDQARQFRQSVGLTAHQQRVVRNFRQSLEAVHEGNLRALTYELRDHRFDPSILRAQREVVPLSGDQITRMTTRYRERFVKYRAEVIARTEALRAVRAANHEAYLQAADEGNLEEQELERTWIATSDERTRPTHDRANGQKVGLREMFIVGGVEMQYPGDPTQGIQCR